MPSEYESAPARPPRTVPGPRHAAPRKGLLARVPVGKALALAAVPAAVFVGTGLSPRLAQAEDDPADRWAPGPCVEQSEEPDAGKPERAEPEAGETAEPSPGPSGEAGAAQPDPAESPSAGSSAEPESSSPSPSPSPSESEPENPWWDPLGVGEKIEDAFTPDDPEATGSPDGGDPDGSDPGGADAGGTDGPDSGGGAADSGSAAEQGTAEDAIRDAAEEAGAEVEELDEKAGEAAGEGDEPGAQRDGKEPFPCPTADPEALAGAELEPGIPLLPDEPWRLESSKLTLKGLKYHGIVEVRTYSGNVKKVLKFTADGGVDIKDMHQTVAGPGDRTSHIRSDEGSTSTMRDGTVTMYTEELKGDLFGLIPVTFSPRTPPPLDVPLAVFTDVQVRQAGQFGGTLHVPGLRNTID